MPKTAEANKFLWLNLNSVPKIAIAINLVLMWGCQVSESVTLNSPTITRKECETDAAFVYIPPGEFIQGSDRAERDYGYQISAQAITKPGQNLAAAEARLRKSRWFDKEDERQQISLPAVCISRNLVTNQEYQEFIIATKRQPPGISPADYQQQGFLVHPYTKVEEFLWKERIYPPGTENHPVVLISYEDAEAYADWKSQQTGATYRLPTATEWEQAARSNDGRYFPWGDRWQDNSTNWAGSKLNYTSAIASYPLSKSPYGVEDMAGNVFEYTSTLQQQNTRAMMKGCSWDDLPGFCRSAYQHTRPVTSKHILFGFRLIKE